MQSEEPTNSQSFFSLATNNWISHNTYHKNTPTAYNTIADLSKIPLAFSGY